MALHACPGTKSPPGQADQVVRLEVIAGLEAIVKENRRITLYKNISLLILAMDQHTILWIYPGYPFQHAILDPTVPFQRLQAPKVSLSVFKLWRHTSLLVIVMPFDRSNRKWEAGFSSRTKR